MYYDETYRGQYFNPADFQDLMNTNQEDCKKKINQLEKKIKGTIKQHWSTGISRQSSFLTRNNDEIIDASSFDKNQTILLQNKPLQNSTSAVEHIHLRVAVAWVIANGYISDFSAPNLADADSWLNNHIESTIVATDNLVFGTVTAHAAANAYETTQTSQGSYKAVQEAYEVIQERINRKLANNLCLIATPDMYMKLKLDDKITSDTTGIPPYGNYRGIVQIPDGVSIPVYEVGLRRFSSSYTAIIIDKSAIVWTNPCLKFRIFLKSEKHGEPTMDCVAWHDAFVVPERGIAMQAIKTDASKTPQLSTYYSQHPLINQSELDEYQNLDQPAGSYKFPHRQDDFLHHCLNEQASWAAVRVGGRFVENAPQ